ncbi:unnamed protein product [Blepharisma stoltei]|uniref:ENTH domain-containing protein n=1 Tax=Blepharisma stoltei TaxID=1481888 RepID=A0AAU9ISB2_9CILI|nr:unnamed protein product [Blepharisma stoltei]
MESVAKAATNLSNRITKSELELLIIDCTTDDDNTPPKNVQLAIAQRTTSGTDIETIMKSLYENLRAPDREWRKINKTLGLIHTLLLSGSHQLVGELKNSLHILRGFESFSYRENGIIERGGTIRDKARQINYLLSNSGILEEERGESTRLPERHAPSSQAQYNSYEPRNESHNYQAPSNERIDKGFDQIFGNQSSAAEIRQRNTRMNAISSENRGNHPQRQEQRIPSNGNSWPAQEIQGQPSHDIFAPLPARRSDHYQQRNVVNEVELIQDEEENHQMQSDLIADSNFQGNANHEPFQKPNDIFQPIPTHFQKPQAGNHNFPPIPQEQKKPMGDVFQPIHKPPPTKVQTNNFQPITQTAPKQVISPSKQQGSLFKDLNTKSPPSAPKSSWEQEISNLSLNPQSQTLSQPKFQAIPEFPSVSISQNIPAHPTIPSSQNIPDLFQPLPQPSNIQSSYVQPTQPLSPAKSNSHIKVSHNLDTTSGVSISQLKLSPSLVQSQAPQTQQKTEKPRNLEDALLGLEELSSSLSTSKEKEQKPARSLGYY